MAETVSDCIVISDVPTDLKTGADIDKEFTFEIPKNAALAAEHSILSLMAHSMRAAKVLKAKVSIRPPDEKEFIQVWSYGPTDADLTRSFHEVVKTKENGKAPLEIGFNVTAQKQKEYS